MPSDSDILLRFGIVLSSKATKSTVSHNPNFRNRRVLQRQPIQVYHFSTTETERRSLNDLFKMKVPGLKLRDMTVSKSCMFPIVMLPI